MTNYRVKFVNDANAKFEECNGSSEPLTKAEYAENSYRGCPNHPRSKVPPSRVEHGRAWCGECETEYADIPYAEYLAYYGNPERHIYLGMVIEEQCHCCQSWTVKTSLWGISFMDDSIEWLTVRLYHYYPSAEAIRLPGELGSVANILLAEVMN